MKKLLVVGVVAFLCGCLSTAHPTSGSAHHLVLCWLKAPGDGKAIAELVRVSSGFVDIPRGSFRVGRYGSAE